MDGSSADLWNRPITRPPPEALPKMDNESYYRHGVRNIEPNRGDKNQSWTFAGRYGNVPPAPDACR